MIPFALVPLVETSSEKADHQLPKLSNSGELPYLKYGKTQRQPIKVMLNNVLRNFLRIPKI